MTDSTLRVFLPDTDATETLGRALAETRPAIAVVHLAGDLGAGKSTLARALLRTLGVQGAIRSPTYTLVERYRLADGGEALHLDLYRIGDAAELEFLGLPDAEAALWLVEWPERGGASLPAPDVTIALALEGQGRGVELVPATSTGRRWIERLRESARLQGVPAVV